MHLFALEFGLPVHAKRTSTRIVPVEWNLPVLANLATLCKWNLVKYPITTIEYEAASKRGVPAAVRK
jgi:hypothetical protein